MPRYYYPDELPQRLADEECNYKLEDARRLVAEACDKLEKLIGSIHDLDTQCKLSGTHYKLRTAQSMLSSLSSSSSLTANHPVSNSAAAAADDGEECLALKLAWEERYSGHNSAAAAVVYGSPAEPTKADLEAIKTAQEELNRGYSASKSASAHSGLNSSTSTAMSESKESCRPPAQLISRPSAPLISRPPAPLISRSSAPSAPLAISSIGVQRLAVNGHSVGTAPPKFTHTPPKGSKGAGGELAAMLARRRAGIPE